jgi:hypothetical protein
VAQRGHGDAGGKLAAPWFGTLPRDGEVDTFRGSTIADAQEVIALAAAGLIRDQVEEFSFDTIGDAYAQLARFLMGNDVPCVVSPSTACTTSSTSPRSAPSASTSTSSWRSSAETGPRTV